MSFYWECLGQKYPFRKDKTYLIYYRGCFCPPHRGHFNTVKEFTDIGSNVHVMVHQIGSSSRHGVARSLNRKIWKTYIEELLPVERTHLVKYRGKEDILDLEILNKVDTVIYVRGNEGQDIDMTQKWDLQNYASFMKKLSRRGISMDFVYLDRPLVEVLSATVLTKTLIQIRKKCRNKKCECRYKQLRRFFPRGLRRQTILSLVAELEEQPLHV